MCVVYSIQDDVKEEQATSLFMWIFSRAHTPLSPHLWYNGMMNMVWSGQMKNCQLCHSPPTYTHTHTSCQGLFNKHEDSDASYTHTQRVSNCCFENQLLPTPAKRIFRSNGDLIYMLLFHRLFNSQSTKAHVKTSERNNAPATSAISITQIKPNETSRICHKTETIIVVGIIFTIEKQ